MPCSPTDEGPHRAALCLLFIYRDGTPLRIPCAANPISWRISLSSPAYSSSFFSAKARVYSALRDAPVTAAATFAALLTVNSSSRMPSNAS
jgi:hypothetical protein